MAGLVDVIRKKFFAGVNYHAIGGKRTNSNGKEESIYNPVMQPVNDTIIEKHLMGDAVIGAYTLRPDGTITWMCFDVDSSSLEMARDLTLKLSNFLDRIPHIVEFSGNKGYHVWIFFAKPAPAAQVRQIAANIREAIGGQVSGDPHIEIFPKQDALSDHNPLGNLVKVPLGFHPVSRRRSVFVSPHTLWEEGEILDPLTELTKTTTIETFSSLFSTQDEDIGNPIELIINTLSSFWVEGQRHDLALFLSGWLVTAGWKKEDTLEIIQTLQEKQGGGR